jgi:N-methylhydantoinase B
VRVATIDAVTVEVVRHALEATAQEMSLVMLRTAHAPIFSEGKDYSCALYDAVGEPLAQAQDCPIHLANIHFSLKEALRVIEEQPEPGDVIVTNDPYLGGSHLPDITVFKPVYIGRMLRFFVANRAHHVDVGGGAPGSFVADATEVYEEGIRIPPVKLCRGGRINREILSIILKNVRQPDYLYGDLHAQLAALTHGEKRITEDLVPRFGLDTIIGCEEPIFAYSESRMRDAIGSLRPGRYVAEDCLDNDGIVDQPLRIQVAITVAGDELRVDFSGSSPQALGPVNSVFAVTAGATYIGALAALEPDVPVNSGCYRPITVEAPIGTVVNPREPASCVAGNTYTSVRIIDTVRRALALAGAPHPGAPNGDHAQLLAGGRDPRDGEPYVFYEMPAGGWGATPNKAGEPVLFSLNGNCENTPIEVFETRFPWRIRKRAVRRGSGGRGVHNGGDGILMEYELLRGNARLSVAADRQKFPVPGMEGGGDGRPSDFFLIHDGHRRRLPSKIANVPVTAGDVVILMTPGGGGWGANKRHRRVVSVDGDDRR